MDDVDYAVGPLDPRIEIELENLNNATDDINKLEIELDEANTAFSQLLSETSKRLMEVTNKVGSGCIEKAKCYYETLEQARKARIECQHQAELYRRASEIHAAAKETVALAEAQFMSNKHEWNFDQAWQDMLNHATIKVMDAENEKAECAREHERRTVLFHSIEKKVQELEEKHRRSIIKARNYFEVKAHCDQMLSTQKERVDYLKKSVKEAKNIYARSLATLEEISNQIHQQRRDSDLLAKGPREPGVGAELNSEENIDYKKLIRERTSREFRRSDIGQTDDLQYNYDSEHIEKRSVDGSESTSNQWELEMQASVSGKHANNSEKDIAEAIRKLELSNPLPDGEEEDNESLDYQVTQNCLSNENILSSSGDSNEQDSKEEKSLCKEDEGEAKSKGSSETAELIRLKNNVESASDEAVCSSRSSDESTMPYCLERKPDSPKSSSVRPKSIKDVKSVPHSLQSSPARFRYFTSSLTKSAKSLESEGALKAADDQAKRNYQSVTELPLLQFFQNAKWQFGRDKSNSMINLNKDSRFG